MDAILECCCGLDVHRDTVVACLIKGPNDLKPEVTIKTFSALPYGLDQLKQWLQQENCRHVAMESTGVYWEPVYNTLEDAFDGTIVIIVCNAKHMETVLVAGIGWQIDHKYSNIGARGARRLLKNSKQ
ncbi:transposase IS1111 [Desulforamulus profundi]|uniref:Transposase IS1111 n=1 Tax=Desulforamulus profundi TaxID=1383067 RepID=A0A2C6LLP2_9FIRM|nr:transposase IS1111 [Desulforamulus profundi]